MVTQEEAKTGVKDQTPEKKVKSLRVKVVDNTKDGHPVVNIKQIKEFTKDYEREEEWEVRRVVGHKFKTRERT